jgi:hypothetical protein
MGIASAANGSISLQSLKHTPIRAGSGRLCSFSYRSNYDSAELLSLNEIHGSSIQSRKILHCSGKPAIKL